ncbi:MAG: hypothetical protein KBF98_08480, partial [Rhodoferax sp.]|nr:hypothetical protein [Rhodoferax sp.]
LNASRMGKPRIRMKEQCVHSQSRIVFPKKGKIKTNKKKLWEMGLNPSASQIESSHGRRHCK